MTLARFQNEFLTNVVTIPHISWKVAQNVSESHFIIYYLTIESSFVKRCQVLMGPSMRGNLMSFCDHSLICVSLLPDEKMSGILP